MSLAILMVALAACLGPLTAGLAKAFGAGFDNTRPRAWLAEQTGWRQRADWAQRNHYEAFAPFAAAVALALAAGAPAALVDKIAAGFVAARLLYTLAYAANWARVRSLFWALGFAATLWLYIVAARAFG